MRKSESGSAHAVIIGVLTIALAAAVGTLFWQNIINKSSSVSTATVSRSPSPSVAALKSFCAPLEKLCFDYPGDWTIKTDDISNTQAVAEEFTISDQANKPWLRLQTGMTGVGGTCGNTPDTYSKIVKTHTSGISGSYLIDQSAAAYEQDTAYAVSWLQYDSGITGRESWSAHMALNNSKTAQTIGKVGLCDLGMSLINGKNAKAPSMTEPGPVAFGYYNDDTYYATEAEATAALTSDDADKAFAILQSAHYQ